MVLENAGGEEPVELQEKPAAHDQTAEKPGLTTGHVRLCDEATVRSRVALSLSAQIRAHHQPGPAKIFGESRTRESAQHHTHSYTFFYLL